MVATSNVSIARHDESPAFRQFDERQSQPRSENAPSRKRRTWNPLTESYQTDEELWAWTGSWDL